MSNNHRSATVSPSSENSPSTEGCGMMPNDLQSEEGSYAGSHAHNHRNSGGGVGGGYAQYSSQDSLPDSPYSNQSLDSQPATGIFIFLFSLLLVFLRYRSEKIVHATPTIILIAVGAWGSVFKPRYTSRFTLQ